MKKRNWRDDTLFELVSSGRKPGWLVGNYDQVLMESASKLGLEVIVLDKNYAWGESDKDLIIARLNRADTLFQNIPAWVKECMPNIETYISNIKSLSIGMAIKEIIENDSDDCELDILLGVLFGFKYCDIKYYFDTRIFSYPEIIKNQHEDWNSVDHVICPDCVQAMWSNTFSGHT